MLAWATIHRQPGIFRVTRWTRGYGFSNHKNTTTQVWIRFYNIPLKYCHAQSISSVVREMGFPLKIDLITLNLNLGICAQVLVEVDLLQPPPEKVLVKRKNANKKVEEDFFVELRVKKLPNFYRVC